MHDKCGTAVQEPSVPYACFVDEQEYVADIYSIVGAAENRTRRNDLCHCLRKRYPGIVIRISTQPITVEQCEVMYRSSRETKH